MTASRTAQTLCGTHGKPLLDVFIGPFLLSPVLALSS
jgi:hypothetical protein